MIRSVSAALVAVAVLGACTSESATGPAVDGITPQFDFMPQSLLYVCKVGLDETTVGNPFSFTTEATGGDVLAEHTLTARSGVSSETLGSYCHLAWWHDDAAPDVQVTLTELASEDFILGHVRIWDIFDFFNQGTQFVDVAPVDGSVTLAPGHGQVVIFYNHRKPPEGCTPGYWRQDQHYDNWVNYSPSDLFSDVFGAGPSITLGEAVWLGGGDANALIRHAVAALLNTQNSGVDYDLSEEQVIQAVQEAYESGAFESTKNLFAGLNEGVCTLN